MKSYKEVDSLVLSAEFNSQTVQEVDFNVSYVLGQEFMVLDVASYLLDVLDDNKLPIVINLTQCPEVNVYSGQYGYRKQDGSAVSTAITSVKGFIPGEPSTGGAVLTGQIQYSTTEPRPESVDIKLSVDWLNPNWADRVDQIQEEVSDSGVSYNFSPSNFMATTLIITDLETLPPGSISVLSWRSQLENYKGRPVKVYSGAMYLLGKGEMGSSQTSEIKFPIRETDQETGKLIWDIVITQPNTTPIKKKNIEQPITDATLIALMPLIEMM